MTGVPEPNAESYLGDGLYIHFDGFQIVLRAPREEGDHWVAIEPLTFRALLSWLESYPDLKRHMSGT